MRRWLPVLLLAALFAGGCAPSRTGDTYERRQIGQAATVTKGQIVSLRNVQVAGTQSGIGIGAGAVAGGIAGSYLGGGSRANVLGALGGAVVGGLAGNAAEQAVTEGNAVEFVVQQDNGQTISVVQTNEDKLTAGERVLVIRSDKIRIARDLSGR